MVIAIYGDSCTGKTTVARALARKLGFPVRNCGEIVKEHFRHLGLSTTEDLPLTVHRSIDQETRELALSTRDLIIEGCFLADVLGDIQQILKVRLVCSDEARSQRWGNRSDHTSELSSELDTRDEDDSHLQIQLFHPDKLLIKDEIVIDTTHYSVDQVAELIYRRTHGNET